MKKYYIVILLVCCSLITNAQSPTFQWVQSIGGTSDDGGNFITVDGSGNIYVTGYFQGTVDFDPGIGIANLTSASNYAVFILKLDVSGNFVWVKSIGGTSTNNNEIRSLVLDASGNVYTTGFFKGTIDFDPGVGFSNLTSSANGDAFILKLDPSGSFIWVKAMVVGTWANSYSRGCYIQIDLSGNIYTAGQFYGAVDFDPGGGVYNLYGYSYSTLYISKIDSSGNFIWAKEMGSASYFHVGAIAVDALGNIYTTGYFQATADFDPGTGVFNLTATKDDIFISKLDASGNFVWAKKMGGAADEEAVSIVLDASDNVYTTGYFEGTVDFDPGAGVFNLTAASSSSGVRDIFISKLDSAGNFQWAKKVGGPDSDEGSSIVIDTWGNVNVTGWFRLTVDFDPGSGVFNLTDPGDPGSVGNGYHAAFILQLNASGDFVWAKSIGGASANARGNSITVNSTGEIFTTGLFTGTVDFNPDGGVFNLTSMGNGDIFVHKMNAVSVEIKRNANINSDIIYPNPFNQQTTISFNKELNNATLKIIDVLGKEVRTVNFSGNELVIKKEELKPGIYFLQVISENEMITNEKIVIQ